MADTPTRMGFEGVLLVGTAGSTASTQLVTATDISYTITPDKASSTVRGLGTTPPLKTERVVAIGMQIEFTMLNKSGDANLASLRAAAAAGTAISMKTKDYASGQGFNGDVTLDCKEGDPLNGEQTFAFTATPTNAHGREPVAYA